MELEKDFYQWCADNHLQVTKIKEQIYQCGDSKYLLLVEKNGNVCDEDYHFILNEQESLLCKEVDCLVYKWGSRFCYTKVSVMKDPDNDNVKEFKYLGKTTFNVPSFPFLGVHGQYEILNGSRNYEDWIKKAKFLEISTLGICEKNTLAGTMAFQNECEKAGIKSILGETITIKNNNDLFCEGKVFALSKEGWQNILQINAEINVINPSQFITEKRLLELGKEVVFVFDPLNFPYDSKIIKEYQKSFSLCYFKLDSVKYENEKTDRTFLERTQEYINNELGLKPILLSDAYYLDSEDYEIKKDLNLIAGVKDVISHNQYFKADDENLLLLNDLFVDEDFGVCIEQAIESLQEVNGKSNFSIPTGKFNLPQYKMTDEEKEKYGTTDVMFDSLIMDGWERLGLGDKPNYEEYLDRIQKETEVIKMGGFQDYFLILWDIVRWCEENNILVGLGRGSGAGCICAWLLNLTRIDPLEYGLLFERFLNKGRMGYLQYFLFNNDSREYRFDEELQIERGEEELIVKAEKVQKGDIVDGKVIGQIKSYYKKIGKGTLPDIDTDIESGRRDDVKKYLESKYGTDRVCSLGTFTSLQMKAVFRDFCKLKNIPLSTIEFISNVIMDVKDNTNARATRVPWEYMFKLASKSPILYDFVQKHADMIEETKLCYAAPRSASVHACAMLILPQEESIYSSVPIRKTELNGTEMIVSEWEGQYIEGAGYLKEDLLGIQQLDKFRMILDLVEKHYGDKVDIYNVPLDDLDVYSSLSEGKTGDVFQLGSKGLTSYCVDVRPTSIRELCAIVALYRPGPMDNGFHSEYLAVKNGRKEIEYMPGLEEITKDTFGLLVYQEQIMLITTKLAGFTLVEADNIRKGMGKKNPEFFAKQGQKFIEGAIKNGYDKKYVDGLWKKMCAFGSYAFNLSHALCYAQTAYICQYLKCKYPLPYWITALEFANDDNLPRFVSEINKSGSISIVPPDINKSELQFYADFDKKKIVWSIARVKQCGDVAVSYILAERKKGGEFFDLREFLFRIDKSKVNKSVIENLILAGAFDDMCNVRNPIKRKEIIEGYRSVNKVKIDERKDFLTLAIEDGRAKEEWWWLLKQKEVSGFAFFDYPTILQERGYDIDKYLALDEFEYEDLSHSRGTRMVVTAGIVSEVEHKSSKKGDYCKIRIEQNYSFVWMTIWSDQYGKYADLLKDCVGKIVCMKARAYYDGFKGENCLQSDKDLQMEIIS